MRLLICSTQSRMAASSSASEKKVRCTRSFALWPIGLRLHPNFYLRLIVWAF